MTQVALNDQLEIEQDILDMGVSKLKAISEECILGKSTGWLHKYVSDLVWPLSEAMLTMHNHNSTLKNVRPKIYYIIKDDFDPFATAVCTLNPLIKSVMQGKVQLGIISEDIGRNVADYYNKKVDKLTLIRVGVYLLNILHSKIPNLFELATEQDAKGNNTYVITFSDGKNLKVIKKCISLILGRYSPMIAKPKDWTSIFHGGYINEDLSSKIGLVRRRTSEKYEQVYNYNSIPDVYDGINFIQGTPFKINSFILDVFRKCLSKGIVVDNLPESKPLKLYKYPLPKGLKKGQMNDDQLVTLRKWASINSFIKKEKQRYNSKMFTVKIVDKIVSRLSGYDRFYFPHNMDYRGRLYPIPVIFNLQGLDYVRAMLLFADSKPITDQSGADWLAIHGANSFGYDKASFTDRISWVKENELAITLAYHDPIESTFWRKAKDPFQFLAFCKEWVGYSKYGFDYRCSLPIGVDATCSGLQHYSAMLKDPIGGKFVNLIPSSKPQDIYQEVANKLTDKLKSLGDGEINAKEWLSVGITRSTTKRVVMTTVYSLTKYKSRDYIQEYLLNVAPNHFTDPSKASAWLSEHLWDAVGEVIKGARVAMDYIKYCTKELSGLDNGIEWKVPSGFKVHQLCTLTKKKQLDRLVWQDKHISLTVKYDSGQINKRSQTNAVCPNVIHSLDSCHLIMVANRSKESGVTHFSSVHDCFYTHACDIKVLNKIIRESFVDMYDDFNFLIDFKSFLEDKYKIVLKDMEVDKSFNLDIKQVLNSDYFFS